MNLKNKSILFIGPIFNQYEEAIIAALEKKGAVVDFVPEQSYNKFYYYLNKFFPSFARKIQENNIIKKLKFPPNHYDYLFVIRGEFLGKKFFKKIFTKYRFDKKILYLWDSVKNQPNALNSMKYFDQVYTFDSVDAKKNNILYKSLFFTNDFHSSADETLYDFFYVGNFYYDRAKYIIDIKKFAGNNNLKVNFNLYMTYFRFIQMRFKKEFQMLTKEDIIFKPMLLEEVSSMVKKSKVVLDIRTMTQDGLSMRIFETFGVGRKLLTNNKYIMNEDFYDKHCICFFDELSTTFLDKPCQVKSFEKHHIDNWLNDFFE